MSTDRSLRGTWQPLDDQVEEITQIVDRLCLNLEMKTESFMNAHIGSARKNQELIASRAEALTDAIADVKVCMYRLISQKRNAENNLWEEKTKRVKLEKLTWDATELSNDTMTALAYDTDMK